MTRVAISFLAAAIVAVAMFAYRASNAQAQSAFLINVEVTDDGAELLCVRGCAWDRLSFSCDDLPCEAGIDVSGVGPPHRP
jgi:hypothetical protein